MINKTFTYYQLSNLEAILPLRPQIGLTDKKKNFEKILECPRIIVYR